MYKQALITSFGSRDSAITVVLPFDGNLTDNKLSLMAEKLAMVALSRGIKADSSSAKQWLELRATRERCVQISGHADKIAVTAVRLGIYGIKKENLFIC